MSIFRLVSVAAAVRDLGTSISRESGLRAGGPKDAGKISRPPHRSPGSPLRVKMSLSYQGRVAAPSRAACARTTSPVLGRRASALSRVGARLSADLRFCRFAVVLGRDDVLICGRIVGRCDDSSRSAVGVQVVGVGSAETPRGPSDRPATVLRAQVNANASRQHARVRPRVVPSARAIARPTRRRDREASRRRRSGALFPFPRARKARGDLTRRSPARSRVRAVPDATERSPALSRVVLDRSSRARRILPSPRAPRR